MVMIKTLIKSGIFVICFSSAFAGDSQFVAEMDAQVHSSEYDDFTIVVGDKSGVLYQKSRGNYDFDRREIIASASKLVSAVIIMDLVESNILSLDSMPADFIDYWKNADDGMKKITLKQLLSFTSALEGHRCTKSASANFERCAKRVFDAGVKAEPGTIYDYHSSHLHVAGMMAVKASGLSSWNEVFDKFKIKYSLFSSDDVYTNLRRRSRRNPMLAGGLHTTPRNYAAFLSKLIGLEILNAESLQAVFSDYTSALKFEKSPIQSGLDEHWDYGLGVWVECEQSEEGVANCDEPLRYSSAGAFGFYPWIDNDMSYFALVARKGKIFGRGDRADVVGIRNGREFQPIVEKYLGD